jgi:hypothetical protein
MKTPAPSNPPRVDDHFVREDERVQVVKGKRHMSPPAEEPHATAHFSLAYVLAAHVTAGFVGAVDMLTRTSVDSNFAPDASVFPAERDPVTGGRKLEELAFEVASTQPLDDAGDKARELVRRGVRRVFCIVVRHRRVVEWSAETDSWSPLPDSASIDDPCFVRPLPVRALLDAAAADNAVVAALVARGSPAIRAVEARAQAEGRAEGRTEGRVIALLAVLGARGLVPSDAQVARIRTAPAEALDRWLLQAAVARSLAELLELD